MCIIAHKYHHYHYIHLHLSQIERSTSLRCTRVGMGTREWIQAWIYFAATLYPYVVNWNSTDRLLWHSLVSCSVKENVMNYSQIGISNFMDMFFILFFYSSAGHWNWNSWHHGNIHAWKHLSVITNHLTQEWTKHNIFSTTKIRIQILVEEHAAGTS